MLDVFKWLLCNSLLVYNSYSQKLADFPQADVLNIGSTFEQEKFLNNMQASLSKQNSLPTTDASSKYNKTYQACTSSKGAGHCKLIELCNWNELKQDPLSFSDNLCVIEGTVAGVCCPDNFTETEGGAGEIREARASSSTTITEAKECGINGKSATRIRAGQMSRSKDWPWMAVLLRRVDYFNFCGGVLLRQRYVLTAAHCVVKKTTNDFYVRLGEYNFSTPYETQYVDFVALQIIVHDDYDPATQRHDIALLKLNKPAVYNDFIRPICLPQSSQLIQTNSTVIVAGWGSLFYGSSESDVLMEVPVPIWDISECASKYVQPIFRTNICAAGYEGGKDACQGDSGGPLLMQMSSGKWTTIGVVSWGIGCGEIDQPGIYTKVQLYLDWIIPRITDSAP